MLPHLIIQQPLTAYLVYFADDEMEIEEIISHLPTESNDSSQPGAWELPHAKQGSFLSNKLPPATSFLLSFTLGGCCLRAPEATVHQGGSRQSAHSDPHPVHFSSLFPPSQFWLFHFPSFYMETRTANKTLLVEVLRPWQVRGARVRACGRLPWAELEDKALHQPASFRQFLSQGLSLVVVRVITAEDVLEVLFEEDRHLSHFL